MTFTADYADGADNFLIRVIRGEIFFRFLFSFFGRWIITLTSLEYG